MDLGTYAPEEPPCPSRPARSCLQSAAANTIRSGDIVDGQVKTRDLAAGAVTSAKMGDGSVGTSEVRNDALTTADIRGADVNGTVSLSGVPNGRCSQATLSVSGALAGQVQAGR